MRNDFLDRRPTPAYGHPSQEGRTPDPCERLERSQAVARLEQLEAYLQVAHDAAQFRAIGDEPDGISLVLDQARVLAAQVGRDLILPEEPIIKRPEVLISIPVITETEMRGLLAADFDSAQPSAVKGIGVLDFYADMALTGDHRVGPLFDIPAADWIHEKHRRGWISAELNFYKERLAREGRLENYRYPTAHGNAVRVNTRLGEYRDRLVRVVQVLKVD